MDYGLIYLNLSNHPENISAIRVMHPARIDAVAALLVRQG
jgi:hypothetical protein